MNEIFEFRKKLNIKKILIVSLLFFILLVIILWKFFMPKEKFELNKNDSKSSFSTFYSKNKEVSLSLSKNYNFIQYQPANNYLLELRNENNLDIFISKEAILENKLLSEIVSTDFKSYIEQFNNSSNISNIAEFDRGGLPAYTYSFHYLDSKTNTQYYIQTIWIEYNNYYYILDIEFPLNSLNENSKIINDILNSIIIN